jgi:hypothetical protein
MVKAEMASNAGIVKNAKNIFSWIIFTMRANTAQKKR